MSAITQVGSYARYLGTVRTLSDSQARVDDLTRQLTTGKKSTDLSAFGPDTQKLLDLRAELVKRSNYVQSLDTATPRLKGIDVAMTTIEKMASDWQSSSVLPFQPGPPRVSSPSNPSPDALKISIDATKSKFPLGANYTVTAIPSETGANGSYDVTVTDGLGGRSTRTINLNTVPPSDGTGYNFSMTGGPGDGGLVNITFDTLKAAGSSTFKVDYPQADQVRQQVEGAMEQVRGLLNERFGDRYLFAGGRYATEPVGDVLAERQHSAVTLNGSVVEEEDYFEVTVNGKVFSYQVAAADPKTITYVAQQLTTQLQTASPALPMKVTTANGVITLIADDPGKAFDVSARVNNRTIVANSVDEPTTTTAPTLGTAGPPVVPGTDQTDSFTLHGDGVDIGDTFEFSVTVGDPDDPFNQNYYSQNPSVPHDLPIYHEYKVSYTVTADDYHNNGITTVTQVAGRLRTAFGALSPAPPVTVGGAATSPTITLTSTTGGLPLGHVDSAGASTRTSVFSTSAKVTNGSLNNTVSVATLPPQTYTIDDLPQAEPPKLPYYDTEYLTKGSNAAAWDKARVTADDNLNISYGVVSTDPAFQSLFDAFRMIRAAAANPGKYEDYVSQARELMSKAKDDMRSVHAKVASDLATLDQKKTAHKDAMNEVTTRIAGIEGIDETEVSARLRTAMNGLEASYTVIGQTQKLSLLNYIA